MDSLNKTLGGGMILAAGVLTVLVSLHFISPNLLVLSWRSRKTEAWRFLTTFFYFGRITVERAFGTVLNLMTFSGFVKMCEERVFHDNPYKFSFCLCTVCSLVVYGSWLIKLTWGVDLPLLSYSLCRALVFIGCWRCPSINLSLYGFQLSAKTGPWVSTLVSFILSGEIALYADLLGIGSALIYLLAMDLLPASLLQRLPWDIGTGHDGDDPEITQILLAMAEMERLQEKEAERQHRLMPSDNEDSDGDDEVVGDGGVRIQVPEGWFPDEPLPSEGEDGEDEVSAEEEESVTGYDTPLDSSEDEAEGH